MNELLQPKQMKIKFQFMEIKRKKKLQCWIHKELSGYATQAGEAQKSCL